MPKLKGPFLVYCEVLESFDSFPNVQTALQFINDNMEDGRKRYLMLLIEERQGSCGQEN